MERNFNTVVNNIYAYLPLELREKFRLAVGYWAPEGQWFSLSNWVNKYVRPCSSNPISIKVYAELCNTSPEEIKSRFQWDGF